MLRVARSAQEYILAQPDDAQREILQALKTIEENPLAGVYLPFPWAEGTLAYTTTQYSINYRLGDEGPEVGGVTKMPTADDIQRSFLERYRQR